MQNKTSSKTVKVVFISVSLFLICTLFVVYYCNQSFWDAHLPITGFCISVIASILAAIVYSILDAIFFSTKQTENLEEYQNNLKEYQKWLNEFDRTADRIKEMTTKDISQIEYRDEIGDAFWNSFISNTKGELILSGKTLNRWIITPAKKEDFCHRIEGLLNNGGDVYFVIYKVDSLGSDDQEEREALRKCLVDFIFPSIIKNQKGSLIIKETSKLPYFYISNRIQSVTMPYFEHHENNRNLALIIKADTRLDNMYYSDYKKIIDNADAVLWFDEYKKQIGIQ